MKVYEESGNEKGEKLFRHEHMEEIALFRRKMIAISLIYCFFFDIQGKQGENCVINFWREFKLGNWRWGEQHEKGWELNVKYSLMKQNASKGISLFNKLEIIFQFPAEFLEDFLNFSNFKKINNKKKSFEIQFSVRKRRFSSNFSAENFIAVELTELMGD